MAAGGSDSGAAAGHADERTGHPCYLSLSEYLDDDKPQTGAQVDRIWLEPGYHDPDLENLTIVENQRRTELQREVSRLKEAALNNFFGRNFKKAYELINQIRKTFYRSCSLPLLLMRVECEIEMGVDGPAYEELCNFFKASPLRPEKVKMLEDTLTSTDRVVGQFVLHNVKFQKRLSDIYQESVDGPELLIFVYECSLRLAEMHHLVEEGRKLNDTVFSMIDAMRDEVLKCRFEKESVKNLALQYCDWCFKFSSGSLTSSESDDSDVDSKS